MHNPQYRSTTVKMVKPMQVVQEPINSIYNCAVLIFTNACRDSSIM